jgi:hypothetical protein
MPAHAPACSATGAGVGKIARRWRWRSPGLESRRRAFVGSRTHATDVRVIGGAGQQSCRNDTKETNNDQSQ